MIYRSIFINLALTVLVEGAVVGLIFRNRKVIYYSFLCNLLTNPALNLIIFAVLAAFGEKYYYAALIPLEISVVFIEAYIYRVLGNFTFKKAFLTSFIANAVSCGIGFAMYAIV